VLGLLCLTPLSTAFQLFRGRKFLFVVETTVPMKTTYLSQVTDKRYHVMLYQVQLTMSGIRTRNFSGNRHWLYR